MEKINKYKELVAVQKREREAFAQYSLEERMQRIDEFNAMINRHDEARMKALQDAWKEVSGQESNNNVENLNIDNVEKNIKEVTVCLGNGYNDHYVEVVFDNGATIDIDTVYTKRYNLDIADKITVAEVLIKYFKEELLEGKIYE